MEIKELEAKFIEQHRCKDAVYSNYLLAECDDGTIIYVCSCDGHRTMEGAIECHDLSEKKQELVVALDHKGHKAKLHNVIVKEQQMIEFLEE